MWRTLMPGGGMINKLSVLDDAGIIIKNGFDES